LQKFFQNKNDFKTKKFSGLIFGELFCGNLWYNALIPKGVYMPCICIWVYEYPKRSVTFNVSIPGNKTKTPKHRLC